MANCLLPSSISMCEEELYNALQYSGLVTEDMSFDEMCAVLISTYPDAVEDLTSVWELVGDSSHLVELSHNSNNGVNFKANFADIRTVSIQTDSISVKNYKQMRIRGYINFTSSSIQHSPSVTFQNASGVFETLDDIQADTNVPIDITTDASQVLQINYNGAYQTVETQFKITLFN